MYCSIIFYRSLENFRLNFCCKKKIFVDNLAIYPRKYFNYKHEALFFDSILPISYIKNFLNVAPLAKNNLY